MDLGLIEEKIRKIRCFFMEERDRSEEMVMHRQIIYHPDKNVLPDFAVNLVKETNYVKSVTSSLAVGKCRQFKAIIAAACCALAATGAGAQPTIQPQAVNPPPSPMPVPNELELAKLIWSTMAAVDHANQAGNYSVLRDLSAPAFQMENDSAKLARVFETLRASSVDLSNTMLLAPTYASAPVIMNPDILHVKGYFGLRPTAIGFDLYYQWLQGRWRLFGVSIVPATIATIAPGPAAAPPPAGPATPPRQPPRQVPQGR